MKNCSLLILVLTLGVSANLVSGHGRLLDPPSRASAWRVGFNTPKDFNDMEQFCGGFERQWLVNKGRCGICGDAYDEPIKPHEAPGGVFATGTLVRNYTEGAVIPVTIHITATHRGYYEFKLCPNNNPRQDPEQECFERYPLRFTQSGSFRYYLTELKPAVYRTTLKLPEGVTCSQCIIQWTYWTGNRWGVCANGTGTLGCGPQEIFRSCADVSIQPRTGAPVPVPTPTATAPPPPTPAFVITTPPPTPVITTPPPFVTPPPTPVVTPPPLIETPPPTPAVATPPPFITPPPTPAVTTPPPVVTPPPTPVVTPPPLVITPPTAPPPVPTAPPTPPPVTEVTTPPTAPVSPPAVRPRCVNFQAVGTFIPVPGSDHWCQINCRRGQCPPTFCACVDF